MTARARPPRRVGDTILALAVRGAGIVVLLMALVLVVVVGRAAVPAFERFGAALVVESEWRPNELERPKKDAAGRVVLVDGEVEIESVPPAFGAAPVLYGTLASALLALLMALPLGVAAALIVVRLGPRSRWVAAAGVGVELLAAIPSIAFGMWGLFVLAPLLRDHVEPVLASLVGGTSFPLTGRDLMCGSVVLAVMIVPIITALSAAVLRAVPTALVEGTIALGATWWEGSWAMIRESRAGIMSAALLALARAAGETMAVTMVIGNAPRIGWSLFAPAQTMASLLANEFAEAGSELNRSALLAVAALLLAVSLVINIAARLLLGKSAVTV